MADFSLVLGGVVLGYIVGWVWRYYRPDTQSLKGEGYIQSRQAAENAVLQCINEHLNAGFKKLSEVELTYGEAIAVRYLRTIRSQGKCDIDLPDRILTVIHGGHVFHITIK